MDKLQKILRSITHALKNCKVPHTEEENPNRVVLTMCRQLRFPEANIRRALVELNGLRIPKLANGTAASTLYRTLNGQNASPVARAKLADPMGLRVEELFQQ